MKSLRGIFPALLTPFDEDGEIDEGALRALVSAGISRGVSGFYVCGSTGEAFLLDADERKKALDIVVDETRGRVALICHVGAIGTRLSIDLGKHAAAAGVDAISSIPPFYYKFSADEIAGYYSDIVEAVGTPLIPYNFPSLSGVTLSGEIIRRLRKDPRIIGVKFTSNDLFQLQRMKKEDPSLIIYNGFDEIFLAGLSMGADGAIGSTFNIMPEKFIGILRSFGTGDMRTAARLQDEANEIIDVLVKTGKLLNALKYILGIQGISFGECRRPFIGLTSEDRMNLKDVARKILS